MRRWTCASRPPERALGRRLVILGHHYQRDEVIKFADYTGDSYKLAQQVGRHPDAEFIVFCGVHFMAESADVLSGEHQQVILPDLAAGCSMADMADPEQLEMCWNDLDQMGDRSGRAGHVHQFRGLDQGVLRRTRRRRLHVVERRGDVEVGLGARRADSVPAGSASGPQHGLQDGRAARQMVVWDPNEIWGGLEPDAVKQARIILWNGHCSVHTRFTVRQIENIRRRIRASA